MPDNLSNATLDRHYHQWGQRCDAGGSDRGAPYQLCIRCHFGMSLNPPNSDVVVFQLDWTDPQFAAGRVAGQYAVVLSATTDPATFSAVYTVTNGSIFSDSM